MARERVAGEWPPVTAAYNPVDYVGDDDDQERETVRRGIRGTIELAPVVGNRRQWRNYALHKITIAGPGTGDVLEVRGCNFSFARIRITGSGLVRFAECNMTRSRYRIVDDATVEFIDYCNTTGLDTE